MPLLQAPHQDACPSGPAEIIVDQESGFHIDPYHGEQAADLMADFFEKVHESEEHWTKVSDAALDRIRTKWVQPVCSASRRLLSDCMAPVHLRMLKARQ